MNDSDKIKKLEAEIFNLQQHYETLQETYNEFLTFAAKRCKLTRVDMYDEFFNYIQSELNKEE